MKSKKKETQPAMPTANNLQPMLELQKQYSQIGVETPFGAQNYRKNPDGTTTLVTSLSPGGQALVDRSMGLGMTDSDQVYVPQQVNDITTALANRVGGRFGLQNGAAPISLGPSKPMNPQASMPQAQGLPPMKSNGLPPQPYTGG